MDGSLQPLVASTEAVWGLADRVASAMRKGITSPPKESEARLVLVAVVDDLRSLVDTQARVEVHVDVLETEDGDTEQIEVNESLLVLRGQLRAGLDVLQEPAMRVFERSIKRAAPDLLAEYQRLYPAAIEKIQGLLALVGFLAGTGDDRELGIEFIPPARPPRPGNEGKVWTLDEIVARASA